MNRPTRLFLAFAATITIGFSSAAQAGSVYGVSDTAEVNCTTRGNDAPHGLWTNRYRPGYGGCRQYFSFQEDSSLTVTGDSAALSATAINPAGAVANIEFTFEKPTSAADFASSGGTVKTGGGTDTSGWSLYQVGSGNIDITTERTWGKWTYRVIDQFSLDLANRTAFQFGLGANDKTGALGASAWLDIETWTRNTIVLRFDEVRKSWEKAIRPWKFDRRLGGHWDLNMELSAVPLPAAAWLFLTGLLGLFGFRTLSRRNRVST